METTLKTIKLYGHLGKKFGKSFRLAVESPSEAIRALANIIPGFKQYFVKHEYHVFLDKRDIADDDLYLPTSNDTIKFVPVTYGSGGFFKVVLGVALMVFTGGTFGLSMILSGISEMLFSAPKPDKFGNKNEKPENQPSYTFNGIVNTTTQGNAVPLCYGKMRVGSQVISAGLTTRDIAL